MEKTTYPTYFTYAFYAVPSIVPFPKAFSLSILMAVALYANGLYKMLTGELRPVMVDDEIEV